MTHTILLVDDDDVAVEKIQRSMRRRKDRMPIVVAEDGQIALDILQGTHGSKKIDSSPIVLLDMNMPGMNGLEFLEAIRADDALKSTVVFVLTTSGSGVDKAKAYEKNIAGYMLKSQQGEKYNYLFTMLEGYAKSVLLPSRMLGC